MPLTASVFSTDHSQTTSTGLILANAVGFPATLWEARNEGTLPVYLTLNSTVATTNDVRIAPGMTAQYFVVSSRFGVLTTSTSTDGTDWRVVRIRAVGG